MPATSVHHLVRQHSMTLIDDPNLFEPKKKAISEADGKSSAAPQDDESSSVSSPSSSSGPTHKSSSKLKDKSVEVITPQEASKAKLEADTLHKQQKQTESSKKHLIIMAIIAIAVLIFGSSLLWTGFTIVGVVLLSLAFPQIGAVVTSLWHKVRESRVQAVELASKVKIVAEGLINKMVSYYREKVAPELSKIPEEETKETRSFEKDHHQLIQAHVKKAFLEHEGEGDPSLDVPNLIREVSKLPSQEASKRAKEMNEKLGIKA